MIEERKFEELKTDIGKWDIYFDIEKEHERGNSNILASFVITRKNYGYLTEEDLKELKQDLKDLGKFRIIKQGKEFLEK